MDIGCHLPTQGPVATRAALLTFAREAERHHMASLWVSDHVVFPRSATGSYPGGRFPHPPDKAYLEPVAALAAAAVCTTEARLGASVFILGHRHPVVMAKMLTTIDTLSEGRLICGIGVGWWKEELEPRLCSQARAEASPAPVGGRRQPGRAPARGRSRRRLARDVQDTRRVARGAGDQNSSSRRGYSRGAICLTASAEVMTGKTSKSTRSRQCSVHCSSSFGSPHSMS